LEDDASLGLLRQVVHLGLKVTNKTKQVVACDHRLTFPTDATPSGVLPSMPGALLRIMVVEEVLCIGGGNGGRHASSKAVSNCCILLFITWCCEFVLSLILEMIPSTVSDDTLADAANPRMSLEKLSISLWR